MFKLAVYQWELQGIMGIFQQFIEFDMHNAYFELQKSEFDL